jgi:TetR/AcrR family tetracycline transcriptional repressor
MTARIVDVASADTSKRPAVETDWRAQLRRAATQLREVMLSHRDGARLLSTFRVAGEAAVVAFRELVSVVEAAGASPAEAVIAVDTLVSFVNGFTLEEQARARPTQAASVRRSRAFDAGVELIVRGIEAALPARRRPKPRAAR